LRAVAGKNSVLAKFQLVVSDPKTKTSRATTLEGPRAQALVGKSIGEEVDGKLLGVGSVRLRVTGGTDKDGVPMRFDIQGSPRKKAILSGGVGFKPRNEGERLRKLVRGRVISEEIVQVNSVVVSGELEKIEKPAAKEDAKS